MDDRGRRLRRLTDHRIRVVVHGQIFHDQLRVCGLTVSDLFAQLRQRGVFELTGIRFVLYESGGGLTVVPENGRIPELVRTGLEESVNRPDGASDTREA